MTDTDKMHKAMKALTLALVAAAAGRAQADLVVSALFGTEPPSYVHAAVANVLGFTLPTTKIDTRTRRACITVGIIRGAITQTGPARSTAWSWRRQRRRGFRPNSGRWLRCTRRAR